MLPWLSFSEEAMGIPWSSDMVAPLRPYVETTTADPLEKLILQVTKRHLSESLQLYIQRIQMGVLSPQQ